MNVVPPRVNIGATKRPSQWERIKESVSNWRDEFEVAATDALKSYNVRKKNDRNTFIVFYNNIFLFFK